VIAKTELWQVNLMSLRSAITDELVLRRVPEGTTKAWASHDAGAFAEAFTRNTKVVIAGTYLRGRDEVRAYMSAAFSGHLKGTTVISDPVSVEYINAETGLLITEGGVVLPGETRVAAERAIRGAWVLATEDGQWRICAYHSSPIPER
jgi:uncharacterized protein (TIGR02246 family)